MVLQELISQTTSTTLSPHDVVERCDRPHTIVVVVSINNTNFSLLVFAFELG